MTTPTKQQIKEALNWMEDKLEYVQRWSQPGQGDADYIRKMAAQVPICTNIIALLTAALDPDMVTPITGETSDGYHTFNELYEHRHGLFINLANKSGHAAWKSRKNSDGSAWDGWFVAGIMLPTGLITYHLPDRLWDKLHVQRKELGIWDGHTSKDTIERLMSAAFEKENSHE